MVARSDDDDACGRDGRCELCELRKSLAEFIDRQARIGERPWVLNLGGLVESMLHAAAAIHAVRRDRFSGDGADDAVQCAAAAITDLVVEIEHLRAAVTDCGDR